MLCSKPRYHPLIRFGVGYVRLTSKMWFLSLVKWYIHIKIAPRNVISVMALNNGQTTQPTPTHLPPYTPHPHPTPQNIMAAKLQTITLGWISFVSIVLFLAEVCSLACDWWESIIALDLPNDDTLQRCICAELWGDELEYRIQNIDVTFQNSITHA